MDQRHLGAFRNRVAVGVLGDDAGVEELVIKIVAFTGPLAHARKHRGAAMPLGDVVDQFLDEDRLAHARAAEQPDLAALRSEEHTSELQSLMRISYAFFCLKKK